MKSLSSRFIAPAFVAILSCVVGCGSDNPPGPTNTAGSSSGGASGGSAGSSVAGAGGGSAGSSAAGAAGATGPSAGFALLKNVIQTTSCFGSICHDLNENSLHLTVDEHLYATVTTHVTSTCGKLIDTANPAASALVKLLRGKCGVTDRMPYGKCLDPSDPFYDPASEHDPASCVSPENIAAIQAWIAMGAPP